MAAIEETREFDIPDETAIPRNGPGIRRNCPDIRIVSSFRFGSALNDERFP